MKNDGGDNLVPAIVEVVEAFAASPDARLRANAVHAYAALLATADEADAGHIRNHLFRTLIEPPPDANDDWIRRFADYVTGAIRQLPAPEIRNLFDKLWHEACLRGSRSGERVTGNTVAKLLLGTNAALGWQGRSWLYVKRLISLADLGIRPLTGLFVSLVFAAGTCLVLLTTISALANQLSLTGDFHNNVLSELLIVFSVIAVGGVLLNLVSISANIDIPVRTRIMDSVFAGLQLSAIAVLAQFSVLDYRNIHFKFHILFVTIGAGFLVGTLNRLLRWWPVGQDREIEFVEMVLRLAISFASSTLISIAVFRAGMMATSTAAALWLALCPASIIQVLLDRMTKDVDIVAHARTVSKARPLWTSLLIASILVIPSAMLIQMAYSKSWTDGLETQPGRPVFDQRIERLEQQDDFPLESDVRVGQLNEWHATEGGIYRISLPGTGEVSVDLVLELYDDGLRSVTSADDPPVTEENLDPGQYFACAREYTNAACITLQPESRVSDAIDFVRAMILADWKIQIELQDVLPFSESYKLTIDLIRQDVVR